MKKPVVIVALIFLLFLVAVPLILVFSMDKEDTETGTETPAKEVAAPEFLEQTGFLLGTVIKIRVYGPADEGIFGPVFKEISRLEDLLSLNRENSDVEAINRNAGISPVPVSAETLDVVEKGLEFSGRADGAFDITVGPLVGLWHIGYDDARVPGEDEIQQVLPLISYRDVVLDREAGTVYLTRPGMVMDLGGIAKGYVADRCAAVLRDLGVVHAIINLGGNVLTVGDKPDGSDFRIGVQNPLVERGGYLGLLKIRDKSVVSSGTYERFLVQDGKRYHHILNPFTGYPVDNGLEQVTIISDRSVDGDGLSTSGFALGVVRGMKLIESIPGVEAVFVDRRKHVYVSSGAADFFSVTDTEFVISELPTE